MKKKEYKVIGAEFQEQLVEMVKKHPGFHFFSYAVPDMEKYEKENEMCAFSASWMDMENTTEKETFVYIRNIAQNLADDMRRNLGELPGKPGTKGWKIGGKEQPDYEMTKEMARVVRCKDCRHWSKRDGQDQPTMTGSYIPVYGECSEYKRKNKNILSKYDGDTEQNFFCMIGETQEEYDEKLRIEEQNKKDREEHKKLSASLIEEYEKDKKLFMSNFSKRKCPKCGKKTTKVDGDYFSCTSCGFSVDLEPCNDEWD